jgi:hypothetical protein
VRHQDWLWGVLLCVVALGLWAAYEVSFTVRAPVRWALHRSEFKGEVESLPTPPNGELKHVEWDGWGFAGLETNVYLVFDPSDSLAQVASSGDAGKVPGIPCKFDRARRLEKSWYAVVYFTEESWSQCNY